MTTATYTVTGMTCEHCVASVTEEVTELPGVDAVEVELATGTLTVEGTADADAVRGAVEEAGYEFDAVDLMNVPTTAQRQVELAITGMTCASCANRIERKLNKLDGVTATVNYATEKARVSYADGVAPEQLLDTVAAAGYAAELPTDNRTPRDSEANRGFPGPTGAIRNHFAEGGAGRLLICAVLSVPVVAMAMVPPWQFDGWQWVSLALATPWWPGVPCPSTGPPSPTPATARRPWTPSCRSGCSPPTSGPCTRWSSVTPA